jgi:uncharacterized protein YndB with AHSA1/START domain
MGKYAARAVADLSSGMVLARVEIAAPPERVYRALTSDEIVKWWGSPEAYTTESWSADFRVGGAWKAMGRGADGVAFSVSGAFLELVPARKVVMTWLADWDGGKETRVTYLLDPIAAGTRLTLRHEGFSDRGESCEQHGAGWESILAWLADFLRPEGAPQFFFSRLIPPRPSFAMDMSTDEEALMREHVAYWRAELSEGKAIVFGPVADPSGTWGLGVARVSDEAELAGLQANDPAIKADKGFRYQTIPMMTAVS